MVQFYVYHYLRAANEITTKCGRPETNASRVDSSRDQDGWRLQFVICPVCEAGG